MFGVWDTVNDKIEPSGCFYWENRPFGRYLAVPKDYINHWASGHKCEKPGCMDDGCVECHVPDFEDIAFAGRSYDMTGIKIIEHLCQDHAYESGYCSLCGDFWGGIETFEFNNPSRLCEHCLEQVKDEQGDYDGDTIEYPAGGIE